MNAISVSCLPPREPRTYRIPVWIVGLPNCFTHLGHCLDGNNPLDNQICRVRLLSTIYCGAMESSKLSFLDATVRLIRTSLEGSWSYLQDNPTIISIGYTWYEVVRNKTSDELFGIQTYILRDETRIARISGMCIGHYKHTTRIW